MARGGFGTLLSARRGRDGQLVAIKVSHRGGTAAEESLHREAEALRAIGPPTVPEVYETGRLAMGSPYLVMQFVTHPLLAELLARQEGSLPEASRRALALVEALETVHRRGLIHCDLKPENIFVDEAAGSVGFFDFGLARPLVVTEDEARSCDGQIYVGTAEYMAPEQCMGEALDSRTDVYAAGVLLYELLTGRTPFFGPTADVHRAHLTRRPPRPSELGAVPLALEEVVLRCLAKERSRRYTSARELSLAVRRALERPALTPAPQRAAPPSPSAAAPCSVAVLFLRSGVNPVTLQKVLAQCGGQLAFQKGTCFAAVFDPKAEAHPLQGAHQCAERVLAEGIAVTALVDVAKVKMLRHAHGPPRYLSAIFSRPESYPTERDPHTLLLTAAAVKTLPQMLFVPVPERPGLFCKAPPPEASEDTSTVLRLERGLLVGRQRELETLERSACTAVRQQSPTLATVRGDRGLGKSHLAAALLHRLRQQFPGARVLSLRVRAPVQGDAEGTLRLLLRRTLGKRDSELEEAACRARFEELLGAEQAHELWPVAASCLGWLTPTTGLSSQAAAPGALRALSVRTVGELLAASARTRPLLLLLDDAHLAENVALEALEYAARAESRLPLWVCVFSLPGFKRAHPQWGSRAAHHHSLRLSPLALSDAMELCRAELHPAENVPEEALARLAERAQRVPLFIVELMRGLKRQGMVRQRPGGSWYLATDELEQVPEIHLVEWLTQHELSAMPAELTAHTRLCALLGSDFGFEEVEGVVEELEREGGASDFPLDPRHATRRLVELGLLVAHPQEGLRFRNELMREAVARSVSEAWRWHIHRAAHQYYLREVCRGGRQRLPRLAFHAASCGQRMEASALYMELAESARNHHAYLEAEATYTRTLELLPETVGTWCLAALRGRGLMRYRVGRYEDSLADLARAREMARQLGNTREEVEVLLDEATALDWTNDYTRSAERVEQALSLAITARLDTPLLQVRLLLGLGCVLFRQGQWENARVLLEASATLGTRLGNTGYESRIISLLLLGFILPNMGRIDDAQRVLEECITACTERGDKLHLGSAINNRRNLWVARGDLTRALEDQQHFKRLGRELGMVGWEYFAEHNQGELHYQAGDLRAAEHHISRAMELERNHPEVAPRPWSLLLRARVLAYEGREEQARQALRAIREALAERSGTELSPSESVLFSLVEMTTRPTPPEEWQALRARSDTCSMEQEPLEVLEVQALARLRRGERQEALLLLEEALRRAEHIPTIMRPRLLRSLQSAREPGRVADP